MDGTEEHLSSRAESLDELKYCIASFRSMRTYQSIVSLLASRAGPESSTARFVISIDVRVRAGVLCRWVNEIS